MPFIRSLVVALVLCGAGYLYASVPSQAASSAESATRYIQKLGDTALATISDTSLGKAQKQAKLEKLFADSVDFQWVARFVMGRFWRQASDEQKERYIEEYQKFLILHYTSRFTEVTGGTFKVATAKPSGDGEYTVSMQLQSAEKNSEPVYVDYRLREEGRDFKIFDVIVEGVSLITTQRSEFSSVLANKGIDHLIAQLAAKTKAGQTSGDGKAPTL